MNNPSITDQVHDAIETLWEAGIDHEAIAEQVGATPEYVVTHIQMLEEQEK